MTLAQKPGTKRVKWVLSDGKRHSKEGAAMLSVTPANVFPTNPRLIALIEQHNDLDEAIAAIATATASDDLLVSRLKKRKLQLKDEIAAALSCAANSSEANLAG